MSYFLLQNYHRDCTGFQSYSCQQDALLTPTIPHWGPSPSPATTTLLQCGAPAPGKPSQQSIGKCTRHFSGGCKPTSPHRLRGPGIPNPSKSSDALADSQELLVRILQHGFCSTPRTPSHTQHRARSVLAASLPVVSTATTDGLIFPRGEPGAWDEAAVGSPVVGACSSSRSSCLAFPFSASWPCSV